MKSKFINYIKLIILILFSLSMTGCWDSIELKDREIVSAIGIDKVDEDGKIILTLQSIVPGKLSTPIKPAASESSKVHVVSTKGDSVSDALKLYREQISKAVYLQSNRIIVIGEDTAREGLTSILDFFLRYDESRSKSLVLICKGKASDILNWNSEEVNIPSDYIMNLVTTTNKISPVPNIDMHKLSVKLFSKTTSPIITSVEVTPQKSGSPHLKYTGVGVLKKDKLVGWLNVNETQTLLRITNESNRGFIEAQFPNNQHKIICQRVTKFKTKITPKLVDGKISISLDINEEGSLTEKLSKEEINSPEAIKAMEESLNQKIKRDIEECLIKVQKEYKTDVLGFGEAVHRKYPKEWKKLEGNWGEVYPDIKVNVTVNAKLRGTGLVIDSFK